MEYNRNKEIASQASKLVEEVEEIDILLSFTTKLGMKGDRIPQCRVEEEDFFQEEGRPKYFSERS